MTEPIFILAPMDDVTDTVFRRIVSDCAAPDLTMTEFVNVDGLCSAGRPRLLPKLITDQDNVPVIAQIWGKRPEHFEVTAFEIANRILGDTKYEQWLTQQLDAPERQQNADSTPESRLYIAKRYISEFGPVDRGDSSAPDFTAIDLNFGCPDKAVVKNECCSAMAQEHLWESAEEIIRATMRGAGGMPVSFKTRLGFSGVDYGWHELLLKHKPSMLTVHVRTTKQMSKVPAQWEAIEPIIELKNKLSPDTKIILNGDIMSRRQGIELADKHGVDGVMIGRGIFQDPYCFALDSPWIGMPKQQRVDLLVKHFTIFSKTYKNSERKFNPLKKFAKVYISQFPGSSELRDQIMQTASIDEALKIL